MTISHSRRAFLRSFATAGAAVAWPSWMPRMAFSPAQEARQGDTLVVVFLRGAADTLNMVVPFGEDGYYQRRPTIGIPRPDDNRVPANLRTVDLDGFFGLHPSMAALSEVYSAGDLGIIHACGAPDESRSHFKAMALMERGVEDEQGPASGWIGRHMATHNTNNPSPLRAVGLGPMPQRSLQGSVPVSALQSIIDFHLGGDARAVSLMRATLDTLYAGTDELSVVGQETLAILDTIQLLDPANYASSGRPYPESDFGFGLKQIAMLVKAGVGLEVAAIDLGGWDTHFGQGGSEGLMAGLMQDLADGLAAFYSDLVAHHSRLTVVTMSEFGRRVQENASLGTDHGHGSMMLLMGGNVAGGKVHGLWPGLAGEQLFGPGDLAVTTDYRDVLGEVLARRLHNAALDEVFPGYGVTQHGFLRS